MNFNEFYHLEFDMNSAVNGIWSITLHSFSHDSEMRTTHSTAISAAIPTLGTHRNSCILSERQNDKMNFSSFRCESSKCHTR